MMQVGVIDHILAGGAQVDDLPGRRGGFAEGVDMRHNIMPELGFPMRGPGEVDVVQPGFHLLRWPQV